MLREVLLYIELPPPMHGVTYINKIIHDNLKSNDSYFLCDTNFTLDVKEVNKKSFKKVFKNIFADDKNINAISKKLFS